MQKQQVSICRAVLDCINQYYSEDKDGASGYLIWSDSCIIGCKAATDGPINPRQILHGVPSLSVHGIFTTAPTEGKSFSVNSADDEFYVLTINKDDCYESVLYWYSSSGECHPVQYNIHDSSPHKSCIPLRLRAQLKLGFEIGKNKDDTWSNLLGEVDYLKDLLGSDAAAYHLSNTNIILASNDLSSSDISSQSACKDLLTFLSTEDSSQRQKGKRTVDGSYQEAVDVKLLLLQAGDNSLGKQPSCAPVIHHEHREFSWMDVPVNLDVLCHVNPVSPVTEIPSVLTTSLMNQLDAASQAIIKYSKHDKGEISAVSAYNFWPSPMEHPITLFYPNNRNDEALTSERGLLHDEFLLPKNRPLLKRLNAYRFPGEAMPGGYLVNPHVGLPASSVKGGKQYLVYGDYCYHHYMQDRVDDNGWGCAYRSLQTIVSWLRLQGYTDQAVPSHRDIQQALVDIGDKENKFLGSKQWIGSTEVSYVLDHLCNVASKILFVSSGAELASKGRELAHHFETHGTPVMIGGGVLAHSILGVDWNDTTGDISFLILDPHYTGGEDLKVIQTKGWCGWKGPDFWDASAYYNMCMPQRPCVI